MMVEVYNLTESFWKKLCLKLLICFPVKSYETTVWALILY